MAEIAICGVAPAIANAIFSAARPAWRTRLAVLETAIVLLAPAVLCILSLGLGFEGRAAGPAGQGGGRGGVGG